jgi:hypothetical protein
MADGPDPSLTGGCNCGALRFELSEPPLGAVFCHCKRCQKRTGTAFSVSALCAPGSFELIEEGTARRSWSAGEGWTKEFCSNCGGHVFTTNPEDEELIAVRMGSFDQDPGIRPAAHQFTDYAAPWLPIPDDGLPRFPERLPSYEPPPDQ